MKFWAPALLATGAAASAVIEPHLVPIDNKVNLFADNGHAKGGFLYSRHGDGNDDAAAPPSHPQFTIPTSYESAVLARRILSLTTLGTISTVFPHDAAVGGSSAPPAFHIWENRPAGLGGVPVGLPEYLAACEEGNEDGSDSENAGNPTLLAISIATTFKNARAGSNVSLALQWEPPHPPSPARVSLVSGIQKLFGYGNDKDESEGVAKVQRFPPSVAALPRFSLIGYLEPITGQDAPYSALAKCFVASHPDAKYWLPGSRVHQSEWLRLVVTQVYWIGGFGDRAYIGWIPVEEWRNVSRAEYEKAQLPGEHNGWKASAVGYEL
ncbi:uncharacterized protein SPSK_09588 [Sporothrix schenckii 1099-18]|uniref:CREG-like beta-barrel domain-containing protein n=2 Tax=Sporothrix schenckii TaxID=29908 RepID=U7PYS7_SPOS1|nr:uncharacterized protein SPSK_09588 [Sporothrix schenckii 1099-18]ERT00082.1 hypothetical protein HMPREF1624_03451 [Sporothrix schenckii ATCC 58251]KJR85482.1 hypothetical protein SPSK_09588 [Sporothrix schenckii 1099-18]